MSWPEDIPEDIRESARQSGLGTFSIHGMIVIARAALAERTRCLSIAKRHEQSQLPANSPHAHGYEAAARAIYAEIEKGAV